MAVPAGDTGMAVPAGDTGMAVPAGTGLLPATPFVESPYLSEIREISAAFVGGPPPRVSADDGLQAVRIGDVELRVMKKIDRCVMVTRPQPDGIDLDRQVLRTIHRERGGYLAIGALVTRAGVVRVGDTVSEPARRP